MARQLNIGDYVRVNIYTRLDSQVAINRRIYVVTDSLGTGQTDLQFAATFAGTIGGDWKAMLAEEAEFLGVGVQVVFPLESEEVYSVVGSGPGERPGGPLPPQVSGIVTLRTGLAGRRNRGRIYIPFPAEGDNVAPGRPGAAYLGFLAAIGTTLTTPITSGAGGNTAKLTPNLTSTPGTTRGPLILFTERNYWVQQRRRSYARRGDRLPPIA